MPLSSSVMQALWGHLRPLLLSSLAFLLEFSLSLWAPTRWGRNAPQTMETHKKSQEELRRTSSQSRFALKSDLLSKLTHLWMCRKNIFFNFGQGRSLPRLLEQFLFSMRNGSEPYKNVILTWPSSKSRRNPRKDLLNPNILMTPQQSVFSFPKASYQSFSYGAFFEVLCKQEAFLF